ncbi:ShlB/FhaC/HecB family hemolysin secretion/activation protein [Saccharospirillum mangrovi]|uniref:ShlB/FhaC/HecB family hemolysin secretion/activation protein n=1 Tax=Saccharospirillum mangrovi TaxID=2161747 RepID=UPI0013B3B3CD|nr:ShlB/FhaC/HecB family hemolysin secretion/activation protein [Saccharospirillum mangrovi]
MPDRVQPGAVRNDTLPRIPPESATPLLEIPPVVERPLAVDEGERIQVSRFELVNARDLPQYGIVLAELEALVEAARLERPQGFTIGQLEAVTERIANYYRARGLILAQAILPVQTVTEGVVKLEVLEGRLGRVLAEGNSLYSEATLQRPFEQLLGEPVSQQAAESALLVLTDYPGLTAFGMFQPGQRVGETNMLIRVPNEERFNTSVRLDNHGSDTTGLWRGRVSGQWNNVSGHADQLGLTLQHSVLPANSLFGELDYNIIWDRYWRAGAYANRNSFSVGGDFENLDISGVSTQVGLSGERIWQRSRERNLSNSVELALKQATTDRFGSQANVDQLTTLTLGVDYDSVDTRFSGLNYAGVEVSTGFNNLLGAMGDSAADLPSSDRPSRRGGSGDYAAGSFVKGLVFYSRLQNLNASSSLLARTEFQYSPSLLVPMEQYAVGGADHVRGFPGSYALYDTGGLFSLEYFVQAPFIGDDPAFGGWRWRELLQLTVFYDHSIGQKNDPLLSEVDGLFQLSTLGVGVRFGIPDQLTSRLQFALPLADESGNDEEAQPRLWLDLAWNF